MEHPSKIFKHPLEALFVIVLKIFTKELTELPIFQDLTKPNLTKLRKATNVLTS